MKLILTIVILLSLMLICNIGEGQNQMQVTVIKVDQVGKNKYHLECENREGVKVYLRYGFSGGWIGGRFTHFAPGLKLTVHKLKGKKIGRFYRSRITVND